MNSYIQQSSKLNISLEETTLFPQTSKSKGISCDLDIEEIVEKCGKLNRY